MKLPVYVIPVVSALLLACKGDGSCPVGTVRLGGECIADGQSAADATVPELDAASAAPCGDGREDEGEACDDGNDDDGDGCSAQCTLEDACADEACAPATPTLRGAPSMAPGRELWTWTSPEGATRIELRLDGEVVATPDGARFSTSLSEGDHTLEARACNDDGCSEWAVHDTVVEAFGKTLPVGLTDTARKLTRTSLGHAVAIGCERCLSDGDGGALAPSAALSALERAVQRDSDVIAFAIASVDGELRVTPRDVAKSDTLTRLADVLAQPALLEGDALLLLDLVENEPRLTGSVTPKVLAEALRGALEAAPLVVRNGRPLLVRTTYGNRGYLSALRDALVDVPEVAPYVRYVLRDPEGAIGDFYALDALSSDAPLVPSLDFVDAVSFGYAAPDLPNRITLSRRAGRAVIIEGVPGSGAQHGHALISALRDQADVIITRYQADRAQSLVKLASREFYVDARSADSEFVHLARDRSGGLPAGADVRLDGPINGLYAPPALTPAVDTASGLWGPALRFEGGSRSGALMIPGDAADPLPFVGFLAAGFGSPVGTTWAATGRVSVTLSVGSGVEWMSAAVVGNDAASSHVTVDFAARASAACGKSLAALLPGGSSHWVVVYTSASEWTTVIDGSCAIPGSAAATPMPRRPSQSPYTDAGIYGYGSVFTSASILRFPAGYDSDTAF
jgi:cysteine-rich repeat protein